MYAPVRKAVLLPFAARIERRVLHAIGTIVLYYAPPSRVNPRRLKTYANRPLYFTSEEDVAHMNWLDQSALRRLSLDACKKRSDISGRHEWTLGHLPYTLNFRGVKKYAFVGRVRLIHQKALFPPWNISSLQDQANHLDAVCARVNSNLQTERNPTIFDVLRDLSFAPPNERPPSAGRRKRVNNKSPESRPQAPFGNTAMTVV